MEMVNARQLARAEVLSEAETQTLLLRLRAGDAPVREQLFVGHARLVYSIVARFLNAGHDPEDLFQLGSIGLLKAIDRFDLSYGVKFSTYAVPLIIGEIRRFLRDDGPIKVSRALKETALKLRRTQESLQRELGREPKLREVAQHLNIGEDLALAALESMRAPSSLEEQVNQDEGQPVYLVDRIKQPGLEEDARVLQLALRELLTSLPRRDQHILTARYFQLKTQAEVASELGISQVQVSRLEKAVLLRLRQLLL